MDVVSCVSHFREHRFLTSIPAVMKIVKFHATVGLEEFSPKFHFHIGLTSMDGGQNQRKLNSEYLNHPALESAGREPGKESAYG